MKALFIIGLSLYTHLLMADATMLAPQEFGPIKSIVSDGRSTCVTHAELSCFGNNDHLQNALPILSAPTMVVVGLNTTLVVDNGKAIINGEKAAELNELVGKNLILATFKQGKLFKNKTSGQLNLCLTQNNTSWACIGKGQSVVKIENVKKIASNDTSICFQQNDKNTIECFDGENISIAKKRVTASDLVMTNNQLCWNERSVSCQNLVINEEVILKKTSSDKEIITFLGSWSNGLCIRSNFSFGNGDFDIACYNSQLNRQRFIKQETTQRIEGLFAANGDIFFLEKHVLNKKLRIKQVKSVLLNLENGVRTADESKIIPIIGQYEYYEKYPTGTLGHITFSKTNFAYDATHISRSLYAQEGKSLKNILAKYNDYAKDNNHYHFMLYFLRSYLSEYGSYAATEYYVPQIQKRMTEENLSQMNLIAYSCQTHQLSLLALTELTGLAKEYFTQFEQWENFKSLRVKLAKAYVAGCDTIPKRLDPEIFAAIESTALEINKGDDFRHISATLLLVNEYLKVQQ